MNIRTEKTEKTTTTVTYGDKGEGDEFVFSCKIEEVDGKIVNSVLTVCEGQEAVTAVGAAHLRNYFSILVERLGR
jgi:hypothetical protein